MLAICRGTGRPATVRSVIAAGPPRHGAVLVLGAALARHRPVQGAVGVARRVGVRVSGGQAGT